MGTGCSKCARLEPVGTQLPSRRQDSPDPAMYDLMRKSVAYTGQTYKPPEARSSSSTSHNSHHSSNKHHNNNESGQYHLLYKQQKKLPETGTSTAAHGHTNSKSAATGNNPSSSSPSNGINNNNINNQVSPYPTRLVIRRHSLRHHEEGMSGTHIYAIRYPHDKPLDNVRTHHMSQSSLSDPEQAPRARKKNLQSSSYAASATTTSNSGTSSSQQQQQQHPHNQQPQTQIQRSPVEPASDKWPALKEKREQGSVDYLFRPSAMAIAPKQQVTDWVTISAEHNIYVADVGMTVQQCDHIVQVTEQVCRGQYAAYTYAKQTLGCREFPSLAQVCQPPVHTITHEILEFSDNAHLALDDREPHMVKYDVTKRERQKLDMHTDKSEWTFLIALSNGSGMDYEGGGTYFECIDTTVHVQRGHALIFPGKLRHCGQRITSGLRFLLVGFLVDKSEQKDDSLAATAAMTKTATAGGTSTAEDLMYAHGGAHA